VLAHQRAHLAGRHHLALAFTRALVKLLPRVPLFPLAAEQVARLVEMCADDTAARAHSPATVLDAVLALCGAGGPAAEPARSVIAPQAAVGASGVAVLTRVERLAVPADSSRRLRPRLLLAAFTTLIAVGPVATALLATHGLLTCAPIMRT
jgi:beta-lactamase regulating signal transducer with metallopeptidase domain